jgi:hypothetical protein
MVRVVVLALHPAVPVHADHGFETFMHAFVTICTQLRHTISNYSISNANKICWKTYIYRLIPIQPMIRVTGCGSFHIYSYMRNEGGGARESTYAPASLAGAGPARVVAGIARSTRMRRKESLILPSI